MARSSRYYPPDWMASLVASYSEVHVGARSIRQKGALPGGTKSPGGQQNAHNYGPSSWIRIDRLIDYDIRKS